MRKPVFTVNHKTRLCVGSRVRATNATVHRIDTIISTELMWGDTSHTTFTATPVCDTTHLTPDEFKNTPMCWMTTEWVDVDSAT